MTSGNGNTNSSQHSGESKPAQALVKSHILTHLIEGFVIQEGAEPFPVSTGALQMSVCGVTNTQTQNIIRLGSQLAIMAGNSKTTLAMLTRNEDFKLFIFWGFISKRSDQWAAHVCCLLLSDTTELSDLSSWMTRTLKIRPTNPRTSVSRVVMVCGVIMLFYFFCSTAVC